jgi:hypothetical protein
MKCILEKIGERKSNSKHIRYNKVGTKIEGELIYTPRIATCVVIQKEISEYFSTDNVIKIIKEDDNVTTFWTIHSVWRLTLINVPNLVN